MNEKKAGEIYDYLESNQDTPFEEISKALEITEQQARRYSIEYYRHPRGEFIFLLTKKP